MTLATLFVKLKGDTKHFKREFKGAESGFKASMSRMMGVAKQLAAPLAAAATALAAIIIQTAKWTDTLAKNARRISMDVTLLSDLTHAMEISGGTQQDLVNGIRRMARGALEARDGVATYADAFRELGVEVTDSHGYLKDTETILYDIAGAFESMAGGLKKTALAQEIFGRGGLAMIPMLNLGPDGIKQLLKENKKLGASMRKDIAESGEAVVDSMTRVKRAIEGVRITLLDTFGDKFTWVLNKAAEKIKDFADIASGRGFRAGQWMNYLDQELNITFKDKDEFFEWIDILRKVAPDIAQAFDERKAPFQWGSMIPDMETALAWLENWKKRQRELAYLSELTGLKLVEGSKEFAENYKKAMEYVQQMKWEEAELARIREEAALVGPPVPEHKTIEPIITTAKQANDSVGELITQIQKVPELANTINDKTVESLKAIKHWMDIWAYDLSDTIARAVTTGEMNFRRFVDMVIADLVRLASMRFVIQPLFDQLTSIGQYLALQFGSSPVGGTATNPTVTGNPGLEWMGGPGLQTAATTVNIIDKRSGGGTIDVTTRRTPSGEVIEAVIIDTVKRAHANGTFGNTMSQVYGASRRGRIL